MNQEFCEHLEEYGVAFGRARASYENCLNLLDKALEDPGENGLRGTLENSMDEWVLETRNLRELFSKLVKSGEIELLKNEELDESDNLNPTIALCCECSFQIPRLVFSEFDLTNEAGPKFRGQTLPQPVGAGV